MSYEKSMDELEKIVNRLSNEKINLEEGIKLYSDGIEIAKKAMQELNAFKGSIEILNKDLTQLETELDEDTALNDEDNMDSDESDED